MREYLPLKQSKSSSLFEPAVVTSSTAIGKMFSWEAPYTANASEGSLASKNSTNITQKILHYRDFTIRYCCNDWCKSKSSSRVTTIKRYGTRGIQPVLNVAKRATKSSFGFGSRTIFNRVSKTKTKAITPANHNRHGSHKEPIRTRDNYMQSSAGKCVGAYTNSFWFSVSLVDKSGKNCTNQSQTNVKQNQSKQELQLKKHYLDWMKKCQTN